MASVSILLPSKREGHLPSLCFPSFWKKSGLVPTKPVFLRLLYKTRMLIVTKPMLLLLFLEKKVAIDETNVFASFLEKKKVGLVGVNRHLLTVDM